MLYRVLLLRPALYFSGLELLMNGQGVSPTSAQPAPGSPYGTRAIGSLGAGKTKDLRCISLRFALRLGRLPKVK